MNFFEANLGSSSILTTNISTLSSNQLVSSLRIFMFYNTTQSEVSVVEDSNSIVTNSPKR